MAGVNLNASMNHPSVSRNRTSGTDHWERFDNSKKKKKKKKALSQFVGIHSITTSCII